MRIARGEPRRFETDPRDEIVGPSERAAPRNSVHPRTERNGLLNGQSRVERGGAVLKHHLGLAPKGRNIPWLPADRFAIEQDFTRICRDGLHDQASQR
jgi:hypothetical protein